MLLIFQRIDLIVIYIDGIEALNTYYPAIKNRYKTFGFTIAEVPVEM